MGYDFARIEKKWQNYWLENKTYKAVTGDKTRKKFYPLIEFPYPSGDGLHVGHPRPYTAMDIVARKRRMEGENVLFPIGFDAFGLPTENYAIANHMHPRDVTKRNIERFSKQLQMLGYSFDWDRVVDTTDPKYYKWTQWIFLQMYKHGLAYKASMPVNWCTSCKCVLANEEVVEGVCERCGSPVIRKEKSQWMLRITEYAQRLIDDLDDVDYIERVKIQQRNWIGRSTGAEVDFKATTGDVIRVFTTRCDTLFGATYMVLSPEHELVKRWLESGAIQNHDEVKAYQAAAAAKSDLERTELNKDKTGVRTIGVDAVNPVNGEVIPIFLSDYVLASYGTGAIMAVPGHDQRDWEFAKEFNLPIVEVVKGGDVTKEAWISKDENAIMVNSGFLDGMSVKDAIPAMTKWLEEKGIGRSKVNYKLRDWVFSRQRYWGEPIPLVYCEHCGWVPLPYEQLPLTLPEVESYMPTDNGESPLAAMTDWVNTTCPKCGGPARRETDTMPQWAGSSWYFLRYIDPHNDDELASMEEMKYWLPVDWYNGGMEHTTLHLLYSRFWHRFLYDIGVVPTPEPYQKRTSHGMILGADGEKMSKSRGNVVNPDQIVDELGADAFRMYEMFMGAFDQAIPWSTEGARGCRRFLDRVWRLMEMLVDSDKVSSDMAYDVNFTIKKVSEDYERMKYNTAIAQMMSLVNAFYAKGQVTRGELRILCLLLNPVSPHITEEINELCGLGPELFHSPWPKYDEKALVKETVEIAVQINGKVRGRLEIPADLTCEGAEAYFAANEDVQKLLGGKAVRKLIFVPGRLVNIVC